MRDDIKINDRALAMSDQLINTFESIFDPEIELDIYNLGLIYEIDLSEAGHLHLVMTFTDTNCGCADTMPFEIVDKLTKINGINSVNVEITYNPVWKMTRISRYGRIFLGISPRDGK
ncbi:metal-sulfur cluster assembly factor [Streptococcus sp. S784/96/1]|uniref:metal-sulfur cluster assembly factor n=1 Tax=Streptococcus sp. S784/96/1 TaxID=2653499 RepID=UPI0013869A94|nr:metal-sulfur cluster assembly factor [Streptococcus sp. S784/96/1]